MKLYVVVRRDLPWAVRTVQAIHAATNLVAQGVKGWGPLGPHLVLLGVEDRHVLAEIAKNAGTGSFREPDMGDQLTAVAFLQEGFNDSRARLLS